MFAITHDLQSANELCRSLTNLTDWLRDNFECFDITFSVLSWGRFLRSGFLEDWQLVSPLGCWLEKASSSVLSLFNSSLWFSNSLFKLFFSF